MRDELKRAQASDVHKIVIDLAGTTFIDSNGARLLYETAEHSRTDANRLTLRRGPAPIMRVLQLAGVGDLLPFERDQAQHPTHRGPLERLEREVLPARRSSRTTTAATLLDQTRRRVQRPRERSHTKTGKWIKNTRWSLLKAIDKQTVRQLAVLGEVQHANEPMFRAFLLKEELRLLYALEPEGRELRRRAIQALRSRRGRRSIEPPWRASGAL